MTHSLIIALLSTRPSYTSFFFFFNDTATTEIYTLSLHDALPICEAFLIKQKQKRNTRLSEIRKNALERLIADAAVSGKTDRKSTRLNSSHLVISYAVFCLKKKKKENIV